MTDIALRATETGEFDLALEAGMAMVNRALRFGGADNVACGAGVPVSASEVTVEARVNHSGEWPQARIVELGSLTNPGGWSLGSGVTQGPFFRIDDAGTDKGPFAAPVAIGQWVQLAATYDGTDIVLYVDDRDPLIVNAPNITLDTARNLDLGSQGAGFTGFLGLIDEVRIWNYARTQAEIAAIRDRELTGDEPGLAGYWKLNEGHGPVAFDYSPNGNHGTIAGAAWALGDPALITSPGVADGPDLATDDGLETAVVISLFTDRRAEPDDTLPAEADEDRRGWWGDALPLIEGHRIGSRLWLLGREKITTETLRRAEEFGREALAWMFDAGAASRIEVLAEAQGSRLALRVVIHRPRGSDLTWRFDNLWEGQAA